MSHLLEIENLTIRAGDTALVSDVGFSLAAGDRLGLIGESGSGKSLTSLAALGLLPPALSVGGSIRLDGHQIVGAGDRALVPLRGDVAAIVFQEPLTALDPLMKTGKQVAEAIRRRHRRDRARASSDAIWREIEALFARVALTDPQRIANAYPYEISGGQRQRVAIAMALACRPRLLIADEPTTALDVTTQAEIIALLSSLVREDNMALLFISHDLPVVAQVVDNVVVMREGEVVERGAVAEVLSRPAHDYTRILVAAAAAFDTALKGAA